MAFTMPFKVYMHQIHLETMPFRNRGMILRPVNRIKHVFDLQAATAGGTSVTSNIITAVDNPVIANTAEVQTGSTVHGVFLVVEVTNTEATQGVLPNCYLIVVKNPGGNLVIPAPNAIGASDNKKYVIHQEMVMLQKQTGSNPRTLFKGVIKIPRGYKRFGPNDLLQVVIFAPGVDIDLCLQAHYKEFR